MSKYYYADPNDESFVVYREDYGSYRPVFVEKYRNVGNKEYFFRFLFFYRRFRLRGRRRRIVVQ